MRVISLFDISIFQLVEVVVTLGSASEHNFFVKKEKRRRKTLKTF